MNENECRESWLKGINQVEEITGITLFESHQID